jgi:hypothetical protein
LLAVAFTFWKTFVMPSLTFFPALPTEPPAIAAVASVKPRPGRSS